MQVNSINNNYGIKQKYNLNNNVSFEGLGIKSFIPKKNIRNARVREIIDDTCQRYGNIIGVSTSELLELTKYADKTKMEFLKSLVTNYNARNYSRAGNLKEDPSSLIEIFKTVKKPNMAHLGIVKNTDAPLELLSKLFAVATDKKSLEFVQKVQHDVLGRGKEAIKIITDLLSSKNKQEYIKNFPKYVSYLKYASKQGNVVAELDKMVETGTFRQEVFDAKQAVESLMKMGAVRTTIGKESQYLEQNYSKAGQMFIEYMFGDFLAHKKGLTLADFSDILKMYKTANTKNIQTRLDILCKFKYSTAGKDAEASHNEIKAMKKLFDKMDTDKSSANFVYKVLGDDIRAKSIKDLADILDIVPSKKAEIFHKNIARIVKYTNEEERINALKNEVENPLFISESVRERLQDSIDAGFSKKESVISRLVRIFENKINKMRYSRVEGSLPQPAVEIQQVKKPEFTPVVSPEFTPVVSPAYSPVIVDEPKTPVIELKRTFKESPKARKLRVQNDITAIIKQKLGRKTFENQQHDYNVGAMVMRLKLLPEIFESIKDTRKMQKMAGQRPNVENKDAINLYSRINGKNRKLVNYMLKQSDSKGQRIYNIKEILAKLDLCETKVSNLKSAKGKDFNSKDAKIVYQNEYEKLFGQYGKLKRAKKKVA